MTTIPWRELLDSSEEGGSFDALPADTYEVVVTGADAKVATTGRDMIEVKYRVESGPYKGRTVFKHFVIVPEKSSVMGMFFRNMAAMGLKNEFFRSNPQLEQAAESLVDRRCKVKVSIRQYGGKERNDVDAVFPPSNGGPPIGSPVSSGYSAPAPPPFSGEPPF